MSWQQGLTKILKPDRLFSDYIRDRDNWRCQYKFKCLGLDSFRSNPGALHCSHFQKRGKWSVRYDPENADAACRPCHNFVETHPDGQKTLEEWKRKQLGEVAYKKLIIRANTTGKRDDKLAILYVNQLNKELKEQYGANYPRKARPR